MNFLNEELTKFLKKNGADLVGFSDLSFLKDSKLKYGICVAVALNRDIIRKIHDGPTEEYYNEYNRVNKLLDKIVIEGSNFLISKGYESYPQTTSYIKYGSDLLTDLPHKTVATRSGLGFIGKSALLVTKEYGPAVRLSTFLTNAPLSCNEPIVESNCGTCSKCKDNCPACAIYGNNWSVNSKREDLIDPFSCQKKGIELCLKNFNEEIDICGKCIEICPYTQKYLDLKF